jgi:Cd2+/Zn2+-exporting ATPase
MVSIDGKFEGYVTIADELKDDAHQAIKQIRDSGISRIIMLSGDKDSITQQVAKELNIDWAKGGLLPEDKLNEVEELKKQSGTKVAFIGDGINDAPVLAISDVGIAMGGLGSDVAIETADVIIQTDQPSKIARAIKIGRSTRRIVWQNIGLAFGVKIIFMILGAIGMATLWEAVFADVGVAFLAILNAVRLQKMKWD